MVAEAVLKLLSTPQSVRERGEVDFILCVGDDRSDEDMFQTVKRFRDHARESPTPVFSPTSQDEVRMRVPGSTCVSDIYLFTFFFMRGFYAGGVMHSDGWQEAMFGAVWSWLDGCRQGFYKGVSS